MRLVVDTNILISALLNRASPARRLLDAWEEGGFDLLTCEDQLDELSRATRYPRIRERITPAEAGTLKNQLRDLAIVIDAIPSVAVASDMADDLLTRDVTDNSCKLRDWASTQAHDVMGSVAEAGWWCSSSEASA